MKGVLIQPSIMPKLKEKLETVANFDKLYLLLEKHYSMEYFFCSGREVIKKCVFIQQDGEVNMYVYVMHNWLNLTE